MQISVENQDIRIPKIRKDLKVYKTGYDIDGSPTWAIYDPLSDNYYKIGWFEFECLQRFDNVNSAFQLIDVLKKETTLEPGLDDIKGFIGFLLYSSLLKANEKDVRDAIGQNLIKPKAKGIKTILGGYVYRSFPLFKPQKLLNAIYPYIQFLFTKSFFTLVLMLLAFGVYLTFQRFDDFANTFGSFFSLEGAALIIAATILVKIFHEFGHAFMAHKYGIPVSTMGVALIVLYPVLYTETTNAWRMSNRHNRKKIALAGVGAELTIAAFALIAWHTLSPGLAQNLAYYVAFVSITLSVFVNLNPFMKFDGYYLFCDVVKIDNLQDRSILFFKWFLRKVLFGFSDEPPESLNKKTEKFLTLFGFGLVTYRIFLYMGISVVVYALFFKPLGFILMLSLLFMFIGIPIIAELRFWFEERQRMFKKIKSKVFLLLPVIGLIALFLPLDRHINVPAVYHAQNYQAVYPPAASKVEKILVQNGRVVKSGETLFILSSSDIDNQLSQAQIDLALYESLKETRGVAAEVSDQALNVEQKILEVRARLKGLNEQKQRLVITAQFDGVIQDVLPDIHEGRYLNENYLLANLIAPSKNVVTAYVTGEYIERVRDGASGSFKSQTALLGDIDLQLNEISRADTKNISFPELSSVYGGSIPADTPVQAEPVQSKIPLYTLRFDVMSKNLPEIGYTKKGIVILRVRATSFAGKIMNKLAALLIRETSI